MSDDWIDLLEQEILEQIGERADYATPADLALALDSAYNLRPHLEYLSARLAQAIQDVENGESRYISISMPPRMGKSFLTSVYFPLWVLQRHPDWELMLLSHDPGLASGWGRQVRRGVEQNPALGIEVAKDAGAMKEWETTEGGQVLARSIRESVTGRGAKVMILDDIVKDFADAHSKSSREFVWDWWTANSRTRLQPPALVVTIGTRWHEDDFIGRLLSSEYDGDPGQWEVISFPAIAEEDDVLGRAPGEPLLSPIVVEDTRQALARWADIMQAVGAYAWAALFQQRPAPAEGAIFNNDWWRYWRDVSTLPDFGRVLTSWDCAFKGTDSSDYVVGQLWGATDADRYLLKQIRQRLTFTETLEEMQKFIAACADLVPEGVHEHIVEDKANGTAVIDVLRTKIPGMIPVNPTDSKEARARAVSPTVESGNVYLPAEMSTLTDFLSEHKNFPNGAYDDQVDCTTQALRRMQTQGGGTQVLTPVRATITRGYAAVRGGRR